MEPAFNLNEKNGMSTLDILEQEAKKMKASIQEKEKQIETLKQSIKFDKRRLKINEEEMESLNDNGSTAGE